MGVWFSHETRERRRAEHYTHPSGKHSRGRCGPLVENADEGSDYLGSSPRCAVTPAFWGAVAFPGEPGFVGFSNFCHVNTPAVPKARALTAGRGRGAHGWLPGTRENRVHHTTSTAVALAGGTPSPHPTLQGCRAGHWADACHVLGVGPGRRRCCTVFAMMCAHLLVHPLSLHFFSCPVSICSLRTCPWPVPESSFTTILVGKSAGGTLSPVCRCP